MLLQGQRPPGRGSALPRGCWWDGGPARPTAHHACPGFHRLLGLLQSPASTAQFTVIPCKPESHFPADGAALLYAAQHSHRSPPTPWRSIRSKGFFASRVSGFCYHSRESWETPRRRSRSCSGVNTSPAAKGEGPSRGSMQPHAEHPWLQLHVPNAGTSIPCPALKHQPWDKAGALKVALVTTTKGQTPLKGGH